MRARLIAIAALILWLQVGAAGSAAADDAPVLIADSDSVTLTAKENGQAAADVTLENQGDAEVEVTVSAGPGATEACEITPPEDATLRPHRQRKMTFTFTAACDPDRTEGTDFTVIAGRSKFDLHADPPTKPDPNWGALGLAYGLVAVGAFILLALTYRHWDEPTDRTQDRQLDMSLPGLAASWKFTDSWAANATVVTALFTGIFGAKEVTTALLGDDATNLLAVALVSAALSLGLVGVSPMILQGYRIWFPKVDEQLNDEGEPIRAEIPAGLYVTPRGLLLAALFTLTGTGGQLATILYALQQTDFWEDWVIVTIGIVAALLLGWYAVKATDQNLTTGATLTPPKKPAEGEEASLIKLPAEVAERAFAPEQVGALAVVTPAVSAPAPAAPERPMPAAIL